MSEATVSEFDRTFNDISGDLLETGTGDTLPSGEPTIRLSLVNLHMDWRDPPSVELCRDDARELARLLARFADPDE